MGIRPQEMRDWARGIGKTQESIDRLPEHAWQSLASTWSELEPRATSRAMFFDGDMPALVSCVVGYVDALGTKQALKDLDDEELRRQRDLVAAARSWFDDRFQCEAMLTFSDNTVVAAPLHPVSFPTDPSSSVGQMVVGLGGMQLEQILLGGRLSRGGVAVGPVFAEANYITGLGLADAVLLEEEVADVPRIVLSDRCRDLLLATYVLDARW